MSRIQYQNSGYLGFSMSRRAAEAYDNGLAPLSKIGSGPYIRAAGRLLGVIEWHHTSNFCNKTDFYSVAAVKALAAHLKAIKDPTGATIEAKRAARLAAQSAWRPISRFRHARKLLRDAADREATAARYDCRAAARIGFDREYFENLATLERSIAADFRAAARRHAA